MGCSKTAFDLLFCLKASDVRDELGNLFWIVIRRGHQTPANATEVNGLEVVFKVNVEHPALTDVLSSIAHYAALMPADKTVDVGARTIVAFQKAQDVTLQPEKRNTRCANTPCPTTFLRYGEFFVSRTWSKSVSDVDKSLPIIPAKRKGDLSKVGKGL